MKKAHFSQIGLVFLAISASAACTPRRLATTEAAPVVTPAATTPTTTTTNSLPPAQPATPNNVPANNQPVIIAPPPLTPAQLAAQTQARVSSELARVGERIFFETDSFALTAEAREILSAQAAVLISNPSQAVIIAGNCDERGTREYNLALGARRANAARDYLLSLGVSPDQVQTVSYGKERPIDTRPSEEGWAVNRNAQTKVLIAG